MSAPNWSAHAIAAGWSAGSTSAPMRRGVKPSLAQAARGRRKADLAEILLRSPLGEAFDIGEPGCVSGHAGRQDAVAQKDVDLGAAQRQGDREEAVEARGAEMEPDIGRDEHPLAAGRRPGEVQRSKSRPISLGQSGWPSVRACRATRARRKGRARGEARRRLRRMAMRYPIGPAKAADEALAVEPVMAQHLRVGARIPESSPPRSSSRPRHVSLSARAAGDHRPCPPSL